jgi:dimeric dUTPase (all-alpha-NTP-PPase superfamily)
MLELQNSMNTKVHEQWIDQGYEWYRAIWIECGELMDHYGYKWWKKQQPDIEQVRLEIVDIWHFGLSALFDGRSIVQIADAIVDELSSYQKNGADVREATERVAESSLRSKGFSVLDFWQLMEAAEMSFEELYRHYIGKNVLNFFRQDHGYKDGSYIKEWQGREDNEHLMELLAELDSTAEQFADNVYQGLKQRYQTLTGS